MNEYDNTNQDNYGGFADVENQGSVTVPDAADTKKPFIRKATPEEEAEMAARLLNSEFGSKLKDATTVYKIIVDIVVLLVLISMSFKMLGAEVPGGGMVTMIGILVIFGAMLAVVADLFKTIGRRKKEKETDSWN